METILPLLEIIQRLRGENGCVWDRKQTQIREKGETRRYDSQLVHASGHPVDVELTCSPINQGKDQACTGAIIITRDISRRIELQRQCEQFIKSYNFV